MRLKHLAGVFVALTAILGLSGCGDTTQGEGTGQSTASSIVVGSQNKDLDQVTAEIYAQALEAADFKVDRHFSLGERSKYLPQMHTGDVEIIPEQSRELLSYWNPEVVVPEGKEVHDLLVDSAPEALQILDESPASYGLSLVVSNDYAQKWNLSSIADLGKVTDKITLGISPENAKETRQVDKLADLYGISVDKVPIEELEGSDGHKSLEDGSVQMAIVATSTPWKDNDGFLTLEDHDNFFIRSHVVPVSVKTMNAGAIEVINDISSKLTTDDLREMNSALLNEGKDIPEVASEWLVRKNLK